MSSFADEVASQIPASVRMISGCHDVQTSADANITAFQLPNPAGRQGGACTAALLQVLYDQSCGCAVAEGRSWVEVLREMRNNLQSKGYTQVPQLSSSRMIDVNQRMDIVEDPSGTRRAVLIGINYEGQSGQLSGCHNDVRNIKEYLEQVHGFQPENMRVLMDDREHEIPTFVNIMRAFDWVVRESQSGDTVWIHYSGHGGRLHDEGGDEEDGYDETLIPVDFETRGQIKDDDLLQHLVKPMSAGVTVTCLMDCCHSGTVLDLPYRFIADGDHVQMERNDNFQMASLIGGAAEIAGVAVMAAELADCCAVL